MSITVNNMVGRNGNAVPNQFVMSDGQSETFQSYKSIIAKKLGNGEVLLDRTYWDYSRTTSKYLGQFLGLSSKEVKAKVKSGAYQLVDLNN